MKTSFKQKFCPYCDPLKRHPLHLLERIDKLAQYIFKPLQGLDPLISRRFSALHLFLNKFILPNLIKVFLMMGFLKEMNVSANDHSIYNRTLVFAEEAKKRGLSVKVIKFFGKTTNFFSIVVNGKKDFFEGLPKLGPVNESLADKYLFKKALKENNLPHAEGMVCRNYSDALSFVREFAFPVVVKPRFGSLSRHTLCNIQDEQILKEAVKIVKIISSDFITEKFIKGRVYRATIVAGQLVGCCLREPPNVVGDGVHSIEELIRIKNNHFLRGDLEQKNFSLHKIPFTPFLISFLSYQKLSLDTILPRGQKVYLHSKVILACGADIHEQGDKVCEENRFLFQKAAQICKAQLIGIDFICQDITKPYFSQECAIIEGNDLPYIDMHHYPLTGKPRNVASYILDAYLEQKNNY